MKFSCWFGFIQLLPFLTNNKINVTILCLILAAFPLCLIQLISNQFKLNWRHSVCLFDLAALIIGLNCGMHQPEYILQEY